MHKQVCTAKEALVCEICERGCTSQYEYRAHMLSHAGLEMRPPLERVGMGQQNVGVTVEETMAATSEVLEQEVEPQEAEEELVQIKIEIPEGMELDTQYQIQEAVAGQHQDIIIAHSADTSSDTVLDSQGGLESSLVQLAEQVIQPGQGAREVKYQILYPEDTGHIVIL